MRLWKGNTWFNLCKKTSGKVKSKNCYTAQKVMFSVKDFFSKCEQNRIFCGKSHYLYYLLHYLNFLNWQISKIHVLVTLKKQKKIYRHQLNDLISGILNKGEAICEIAFKLLFSSRNYIFVFIYIRVFYIVT